MASKFAHLTREELEQRLAMYEPPSEIQAGPSRTGPSQNASIKQGASRGPRGKRNQRDFNFASYPTRHIALLLSYEGWTYSGLALQPRQEDWSPTIEGELLRALEKARLIEQGKGWEGCEFARCGRTDKGVSGAGQVVNLWIRSARREEDVCGPEGSWRDATEPLPPRVRSGTTGSPSDASEPEKDTMVKSTLELPYVKILNSHLPSSIRVLAWSPVSPTFDSRFSCQYRHYKYAFHRTPSPGHPPLDLEAMRRGAERLLGEHDFRNFCKVDGSKQIENHNRRVLKAWFDEPSEAGRKGGALVQSNGALSLEDPLSSLNLANGDGTRDNPLATLAQHAVPSSSHVPDNMVVFNLFGTAFLWHQVRHILAILFLIGSHLEDPSIVTTLLDVEKTPRRPLYMMAHGLPLRLHQCGYQEAELDWRVSSWDGPTSALKEGDTSSLVDQEMESVGRIRILRELEARRQEAEIKLWQTRGAMDRFREVFGDPESTGEPGLPGEGEGEGRNLGQTAGENVILGARPGYSGYPFGGGEMITGNKYIPITQLKVGETVEDINRNYREGRGKIKLARQKGTHEDGEEE